MQLDPENSAAWTDLGGLYESQRQYKDALYCFKKAVQYNPGNQLAVLRSLLSIIVGLTPN